MIAFMTYVAGIGHMLRTALGFIAGFGIIVATMMLVFPHWIEEIGWRRWLLIFGMFLLIALTAVLIPNHDTCMNVISELRTN